jgi:hypothetical protein
MSSLTALDSVSHDSSVFVRNLVLVVVVVVFDEEGRIAVRGDVVSTRDSEAEREGATCSQNFATAVALVLRRRTVTGASYQYSLPILCALYESRDRGLALVLDMSSHGPEDKCHLPEGDGLGPRTRREKARKHDQRALWLSIFHKIWTSRAVMCKLLFLCTSTVSLGTFRLSAGFPYPRRFPLFRRGTWLMKPPAVIYRDVSNQHVC